MATAIIYVAVFLLIFSPIPYLSNIFAYILQYLVKALNFSVEFVEKIPVSHTVNIPFLSFDVILAYLLIFSISFYLIYKKAKSLQFSFIIIIVWISVNSVFKIFVNSKPEFIVYNIKNETAVNILGEENFLIADSTILNEQKIKYGPMNHWLNRGKRSYELIKVSAPEFENNTLKKIENHLIFYNKILVFINDNKQIHYKTNNRLSVDYLILSNNVKVNIKEINKLYDTELIIFDSSNNYYKIEQWEKECNELNQNFYSVINTGAYIEKL